MPASTYAPTCVVSTSPLTVYHRGFALAVLQAPGRCGTRLFGFEVRHQGLLLHASLGEYGTAMEAEGAARRLVDDALGVFGHTRLQVEDAAQGRLSGARGRKEVFLF